MKMHRKISLLLLVLSSFFYSCKDTNSAEATAEKFIFSMSRLDMESARSLSTKDTWRILKLFDAATKDMTEEEKDALTFNINKFTVTKSEPINDSTVVITYETEPEYLPFASLKLVRQEDSEGNGKWKVDISSLDSLDADNDKVIEEMKAVDSDD